MKLLYPAFIHKDPDGYWVEFPDLDGCFTQGDTLDEVFFNAAEALSGYCLALQDDNMPLPIASDMFDLVAPDNASISLIDSVITKKERYIKKTLTIPSWLNDVAIDNKINFSRTLQNALIQELHIPE